MYKSKLQELCQKQKWALPKYTLLQKGQNHRPQFKASVVVKGLTFDTPTVSKFSKEAYNEAAKVAFLHFTSDPSDQSSENIDKKDIKKEIQRSEDPAALNAVHESDDLCSYKNLLQEMITKNEGFYIPKYTTIRSIEPRCHPFSSTVEVKGEIFEGAEAKSKNLAELSAAKAAYTIIMERNLFQPRPSDDEILKLAPRLGSITISDPQKCETEGGEIINKNEEIANSSMTRTTVMKCYLLCNRVKVFTYIPDIVMPKGTIVLPISENRWAMVSLEFPDENGM
ncbi:hypothetical protein RD792_003109 [Penstemon davidsonii]|uniref:DRBM domain-containing protein n=1 Tax=Penstemon davidsonii TaxID=160366 RepID=A0ABR0DTK9_9LAMI|nr:hypothetical protein RD792_003109 [Penstemon davidsonii]